MQTILWLNPTPLRMGMGIVCRIQPSHIEPGTCPTKSFVEPTLPNSHPIREAEPPRSTVEDLMNTGLDIALGRWLQSASV